MVRNTSRYLDWATPSAWIGPIQFIDCSELFQHRSQEQNGTRNTEGASFYWNGESFWSKSWLQFLHFVRKFCLVSLLKMVICSLSPCHKSDKEDLNGQDWKSWGRYYFLKMSDAFISLSLASRDTCILPVVWLIFSTSTLFPYVLTLICQSILVLH